MATVPLQTAQDTEGASGQRTAHRTSWRKLFGRHVLPRLILIPFAAFFLLPFYWMVSTALKPIPELSVVPPTFFPRELRWTNFYDATQVFPFWHYFWNTSVITFLTVLGAAISNPLIAYGFSRVEWPGRDKIFGLVLVTVFIPYPVLIVSLYDIYSQLGWINTILPLVVPLFFGNAFWIFLMRQFFLRIPKELGEAARLDGASELRILWQIILPQSYAAISVVCLFAALHAWNDFLGPFLYLQKEDSYTLAVGLTFFRSASTYDVQYNLLMAASAMIVLPVVILFLCFQRFFIEGVQVGSFK
jgi:multiple sugar transport system permease protein